MMNPRWTAATIAPLALLASIATASAPIKERPAATPGLPTAIAEAFTKAYPGATIRSASKESQNGKVVWEVESLDKGRSRDLIYNLDATAIEIEEQIDAAEIPLPVAAGLKQLHPKATIAKAEKVTRGQTVEYELTLKGAAKSSASFTPDGQPIAAESPKPKK